MELRDYWTTIRRRWRSWSWRVLAHHRRLRGIRHLADHAEYASSARLFVATSDSDASQAYQGGLFATQRVASYADIVPKSRKLAEQVAEDLGGGADADAISGQVTAAVVPDTVNLEITATDPDPVRARDIAQAYAEALSDLVTTLETPDWPDQCADPGRDRRQRPGVDLARLAPKPCATSASGCCPRTALGVGLAVVRELLDNSRDHVRGRRADHAGPGRRPDHVRHRGGARAASATASAGTTSWAESFRVLRTNMQYIEVDHDQKVIVVTSSLPEEGKSTTAVNLARHPGDHQPARRPRRVRPAPAADRQAAGPRRRGRHDQRADRQDQPARGDAELRRQRPAGAGLRADPAQPVGAAAVQGDGDAARAAARRVRRRPARRAAAAPGDRRGRC